MIVYVFLVLFILLLPLFKISKKKYCIIIGLCMTLLVGFRSIYMGMGDTEKVYVSIFDQLTNMSMINSFNFIIKNDIEIVFYMLTRIYISIIPNTRIYILLLSIPLNFAVARLIYKYSKIPSLSFIIFFSINYFAFSFTLIRHCVALAILIISYDFLIKKDLKKFLLTVFIAGLFHRTAWIFIIAYPLTKIKYGNKNIMAIILSVVFSYNYGLKVFKLFSSILANGHFSIYINPQTNTLTFFVINFVIFLFIIIFTKKYTKEGENSQLLLNIYTLGICISSCMIFISEAFRISTFFTIFSMILLPNALSTLENRKWKNIIIILFYLIFILYFFIFSMYNNEIYPYVFGNFVRG